MTSYCKNRRLSAVSSSMRDMRSLQERRVCIVSKGAGKQRALALVTARQSAIAEFTRVARRKRDRRATPAANFQCHKHFRDAPCSNKIRDGRKKPRPNLITKLLFASGQPLGVVIKQSKQVFFALAFEHFMNEEHSLLQLN